MAWSERGQWVAGLLAHFDRNEAIIVPRDELPGKRRVIDCTRADRRELRLAHMKMPQQWKAGREGLVDRVAGQRHARGVEMQTEAGMIDIAPPVRSPPRHG